MNRIIKIMMVLLILLTAAGCAAEGKQEEDNNAQKLKIAVTVFPLYDWCRELIAGNENVTLTQIVSRSSDLHSYQPTAKDIKEIAECDIFIYVGGESDEWVEDVLEQNDGEDRLAICLMDELGSRVLQEEEKEGMEEEHEESHEEEAENDEHVWLSLKNARLSCEKIAEALSGKDEKNASLYAENLSAYLKKLEELDEAYRETVASSDEKVLLFADRFPFLYLCKDYGLDYYAAFKGCSAETEASFETIRFLAEKADECKLGVILCLEDGNVKIAQTVKENMENKDAVIMKMNSIQSGMSEQDTYLAFMEANLETMKQALK
ncbi:MAG: metal ABC transporter substrate-binding protein [Erysipelotrichaceae bacterium]|nr:metal ABC transporter substrate-binding protein [Erysipelotrichaceae bacterium]